jgi:dUTP pyrophosphatase
MIPLTRERKDLRERQGLEMKVKVRLDDGAKMPTRAYEWDAGYDLYARDEAIIYQNSGETFNTGVHIQIPQGYVGFIKSKSGMNIKHSIQSEGVVDSGYTGAIQVKLLNHGTKAVYIEPGQKIAQLVLLPIITPELEVVDCLEDTERSNRGFGSSGKF